MNSRGGRSEGAEGLRGGLGGAGQSGREGGHRGGRRARRGGGFIGRGGGRAPTRLRAILGIFLVFSLLSATWFGLRLLVELTGPRLGLEPEGREAGLLVFFTTLLLFGLTVNFIGHFIRRRHPEPFADLREALRRIAGGDFAVTMEVEKDHLLGSVAGDINVMAESLRRMENLRQEFISTVSHEIQSPLTSIGGFALALRDPALSETTRLHYLSIIEGESGRLSRLAEALLRLTTLESSGLEPQRKEVALDAQIRAVVLAAEPQWVAKDLLPELELEGVVALVDEGMLGQVWTNLLHNAVKFSARGGHLFIALRQEGERVLASFADQGQGLAEEDLPRVFDRFFKADPSRSQADPSSGNGLGLAIVKKIVELHGGRVWAESPGLGRGSVFYVELPLGERGD